MPYGSEGKAYIIISLILTIFPELVLKTVFNKYINFTCIYLKYKGLNLDSKLKINHS